MQDLAEATATTVVSPLPFAPVTPVGLSILIEQHASVVTHAVTQHRELEHRVRVEAELVRDLCRDRTDRMLAIVCRSAA